jgi:glycosyltransferase involved in cell wall biosynthesis
MKILIFSQHFYPESFRVNEIAENLVNRGIKVDVVTGCPNYPNGKIYPNYKRFSFKKEFWRGMSIFRLPIFLRGRASVIELFFNYLSFVISGIFLTPILLRRKKYDLIFCYATSPFIQVIPAIFMAWVKGCKLVVNVQDLWPESLSATGYIKNHLILKFVDVVVNWIYKNSNVLLAQSNAFKKNIQEKIKNVNVIYWPNSVDSFFISDEYKKGEITHNFENKFSVLFAGNIGKAQSIDTILKAAVALRKYFEIEIIFAGDGSAKDSLLKAIRDNQLTNVHWIGRYPLDAMPDLLRKASVLLVTLSDQKIFSMTVPNKVQAYLAVGKPIIGSLNGEGAQVITDAQAGYVVPAGNSEALAEVILKMSRMNVEELRLMGENGREYFFENYENNMLIDKLINIFDKQIKN